jgi:hypothetical protein
MKGSRQLAEQHHRGQVDLQHLVPRFNGKGLGFVDEGDAVAVDENIERGQLAHRLGEAAFERLAIRQIGLDGAEAVFAGHVEHARGPRQDGHLGARCL